jgi:hypothetical protein
MALAASWFTPRHAPGITGHGKPLDMELANVRQ